MDIFSTSFKPEFSVFGDHLVKIVETMPFSARVQDVKTGKYFLANKYQAKHQGCNRVEEVLDVTWDEICTKGLSHETDYKVR